MLGEHILTGANFANQNLADAGFFGETLSNVDFTNANLTNASLNFATLTDADFTNANIEAANFQNYFNNGGIGIKPSSFIPQPAIRRMTCEESTWRVTIWPAAISLHKTWLMRTLIWSS